MGSGGAAAWVETPLALVLAICAAVSDTQDISGSFAIVVVLARKGSGIRLDQAGLRRNTKSFFSARTYARLLLSPGQSGGLFSPLDLPMVDNWCFLRFILM